MILQTIERLGPDVLPIRRQEMFRLEQRFSFTTGQAPSLDGQTAWLGDTRLCRVRSAGHLVRLIEPDNTSVLIP